jgi:hypothetical protein
VEQQVGPNRVDAEYEGRKVKISIVATKAHIGLGEAATVEIVTYDEQL